MVNAPCHNREAADDPAPDAVPNPLDEYFDVVEFSGPVRAFYDTIADRAGQFGAHQRLIPGPGHHANHT